MKKITSAFLFLFLFQSAFSQYNSKELHIKELLELTGSGKMGAQIAQQMLSSFQHEFKSVPAEFWEKLKGEINAEDLNNLVIPVYAKYYSEEEIIQLTAFYKTTLGKKVIAVTPELVKESMQVGQAWGEKVAEKIYDELTEKGYKKESL